MASAAHVSWRGGKRCVHKKVARQTDLWLFLTVQAFAGSPDQLDGVRVAVATEMMRAG